MLFRCLLPPHLANLKLNILDLFYNWNTPFAPQMWTIHYEVIGGSLCFFILAIAGKKKIRVFLEIVAVLISVFAIKDKYYEAIFDGLMISEFVEVIKLNRIEKYCSDKKVFILLNILLGIMLDLSVFLKNGLKYEYISVLLMGTSLWLANLLWSNRKLSSRIARLLRLFGEYSFSFYMIHFVIIVSAGAKLFIFMRECEATIMESYVAAFAISFSVSLLLAIIIQNGVVKTTDKFFKVVYQKL